MLPVSLVDSATAKVDDEKKATSILKLLETLDNCEDVQGVYSNFEIEDEIINKIST